MRFYPWSNLDPDAAAWILATEIADGASLELGVKTARNQLVLDLKSNSLWTPIKTMTVRCGARTLAGALIDLKTPASSWTNVNFVSGDYNRTYGLTGDGSTKYLESNRLNDADPQDNQSAWEAVTSVASGANDVYFGAQASGARTQAHRDAAGDVGFRSRTNTSYVDSGAHVTGLIGLSRSASGEYIVRANGANKTVTQVSSTPTATEIYFYARNNAGVAEAISNHRGAGGGVGEAVNLATLETVLTTYFNSIVALGL